MKMGYCPFSPFLFYPLPAQIPQRSPLPNHLKRNLLLCLLFINLLLNANQKLLDILVEPAELVGIYGETVMQRKCRFENKF